MPIEDFADFIAGRVEKGKLVEVGIGFQTRVALRLIELGYDVLAIDWNEKAVENARRAGIKAEVDNVFKPRLGLYLGAKAIYSIRPTPETMEHILELGKRLNIPVFILPLSGDPGPLKAKLENFRGLAIYVYNPAKN